MARAVSPSRTDLIAVTKHSVSQRPRCVDFGTGFAVPPPVRARRSRRAAPPVRGAVRLHAESDGPDTAARVRLVRRLAAVLLLVSGGALVTTTSIGNVSEAPPAPAPAIPPAAFFFGDAHDALGEATPASPSFAEPTRSSSVAPAASIGPSFAALRPSFSPTAPAHGGAESLAPLPDPTNPAGPVTDDSTVAVTAAERPVPLRATKPVGVIGAGAPVATDATGAVGAARQTAAVEAEPPALAALRARAEVPSDATVEEVVVGRGDTLSGLLNDHGIAIEELAALLDDEIVERHLTRLRIGQPLAIARLADGSFHSAEIKVGEGLRVSVRRRGEGFAVAAVDLPIEKERVVTSGTIEQSLYLAAERAELRQSTIMALADIFQWELDFARDIRPGDHFSIVYDRLYREGRYIGDGDILAAEFERGGRVYRAIRFVSEDGRSAYYDLDGRAKRRTFLRHPVDVVRITSKFDPNRMHPVLHQIRAHRGVDYGAPHGSPIRATADGVVRFSGVRGAYGNTVVLQHGERTETLYAHMSRISDKSQVGRRVKQGEVIGYVGASGRVTGTHLHYEFRVGGVHVDPLTVELPAAAPLPASERDALRASADTLIGQMRGVRERAAREASAPGTSEGTEKVAAAR